MDQANVDRRTFLKIAGAGVAASAFALALPGAALGAAGGAKDTERFLLGTAGNHIDPALMRYVTQVIGS
jgi:anaerobic selenocysteine-containing dehydrogenase